MSKKHHISTDHKSNSPSMEKFKPLGFDVQRKDQLELSHVGKSDTASNDTKMMPVSTEASKKVDFRSLFHYPRGAYFCLGNEFSERFSFYGMKAVLVIYLMNIHHLSSSNAKLIYHTFVFVAYFAPIFGSVLADGFFGRYRVILFVSIVYCLGHVLLTMGAIPSLGMEAMKALDYTGLFIIALATGGIKPCVAAFAADQFPANMQGERTQFFSFFYFMINLGALMSVIVTPVLRRQPCLGSETCFPLAFGIPAIFMCIATLIFWIGTPFYLVTKVRDNVIGRVCGCICYSLKQKFRSGEKKMHWLDYGSPKFDQDLIDDIKSMFDIMLLCVPVVLFWALFEQMGSTWVIQGDQMNGRIGRLTVLPDQMSLLNPLLVIILVPVFEGFIYPTLAKCNIWTRPLRRMGWGGFLAAVSFFVAGLLQLAVDKTAVQIPASGHAQLKIASFLPCNAMVTDGLGKNYTIPADQGYFGEVVPNATITAPPDCLHSPITVPMKPNWAYFLALFNIDDHTVMHYELEKTADGKSRVYFLFEARSLINTSNLSITVEQDGHIKVTVPYPINNTVENHVDVEPDLIGSNEYHIFLNTCTNEGVENCKNHLKKFDANTGAAHIFMLTSQNQIRMEEIIKPNSISIMWQAPQYIVITVGEILFSISGLAFSYSQASPRMKSVFQAIWLLTSAFGNLIDMGLSGSGLFEGYAALEFFVYGAIMSVIMVLFVVLAWRYKDKSEGLKNVKQ